MLLYVALNGSLLEDWYDVYSGFAFGVGLERLVLFRFNIDDMRLLYENDMRFLSQF